MPAIFGDQHFWPESGNVFDFSLEFEETILQILPSCSFILFATITIFHYFRINARIRTTKLLWAKVCVTLVIIALELVNLLLRRLSNVHTDTTYPASSLDFAAAFAITAVVYVEHRYAIRTSALLGGYLAIGILIDATKSRSFFLRGLIASGTVSAVTGAARLLLLCLEEVPKTRLIIDPKLRTISDGEATCGFFSRLLFIFLTPLLRMGYRGVLALDDLPELGAELAAQKLFSDLSHQWAASQQSSKNALFVTCFKAWKWPCLSLAIVRLCLTGFLYSKPFVAQAVISYIRYPDDEKKAGLVGGVLFSFLGSALFQALSFHLTNRLIARIRGGLVSLLFHKGYRLKLLEGKEQASITLLSADFETIHIGLPKCIDIPFSLLEVAVGVYLLSRFIGISCLILFVSVIASFLSSFFFGKYSVSAVTFWNEQIQERVTKTSRVLSQLPAIKSLGLGPQVAKFIQSLREAEVAASKSCRTIQAFAIGAGVLIDHCTPVLVVAVGVFAHLFGDKLRPEEIYPTLGVVFLVKQPLCFLVTAYSSTMSMLACFTRVQKFLSQEEHRDQRTWSDSLQEKPSSTGLQEPSDTTTNRHILRFENAAIAPYGSDEAVLSNLNFGLEEGSVTTMFGPTSSGKTTFVEGILGEGEILEGKIHVDEAARSIAVCGQEIFLPNGTVRDCIIGACEYEPSWFNTVITYCKLLEDLQRLPNGEHHVIGSGGVGLSGGQRQRLGIARSVYAQTKIIVFDDALSALDKRTAVDIVTGLCGEDGLLRKNNCTVILSSYLSDCLNVADNILLLDGSGNATFSSAKASGGSVRKEVAYLLQQGFLGEKEQDSAEEEPISEPDDTVAKSTAAVTIEEPDESRQRGDKGLYKLWVDSVGRLAMVFFLLLMILVAISDAMPNIFIRIWIEVAPANKLYLIGYAMVGLASGTFACIGILVMFRKLAPRSANGLHEKLTATTTQATIGFLSTTDSGNLLNRFSADMALVSKAVPAKFYSTVYSTLSVGAYVPPTFAGGKYMIATFPVLLLLVFVLQRYYLRTSRQLRLLELEAQAPLVAGLRDIGNGVLYFRAFRSQEYDFHRCLRLLEQSQKPYYLLLASQAFLRLMLDLLILLMTLTLTLFALYLRDTTSANATGLALLNMFSLGTGLSMIIEDWTSLEAAIGSLNRLQRFLKDTPTENLQGTVALPDGWPSKGEVIFENAIAGYKIDNKNEPPAVLENIQLRIEPGKKVGVMGRTGSGKSSLLRSLLGFLEYSGRIVIDGVDVKTAPVDELRSRIITISQELVELDGTIRDNLLPFDKSWHTAKTPKLDEKQKKEAERKDGIVVDTLVRLGIWEQLPEKGGLNALLEDAKYSFGERQLFCIARAVVRKRLTGSKLVLVDEATASIDSWREQTVREMMVEFFHGCTIIVVAHREESIADSHRIVRMAAGRIVNVEIYDGSQA
ncbi:hypothetical protein PWT90_01316 [Aphanocladium album]|nr:hypothetical protein PWT90_01316 [Aphanocladium album]